MFNSKVVVDAGASQSDSQQSCRGLLLSPSAEIDSRPQLEIHTDEVKCAHGATTGRLDPNMLFYMLSRGLDRQTAQSLLVYAFLADVLTGMSESAARAAIESALIRNFPIRKCCRSSDEHRTRRNVHSRLRRRGRAPRIPDARPHWCTASRSPIWTTAPPRSARAASSRRWTTTSGMHHANIHRGVHTLSQEATALYEGARERLARFINARSPREIMFVRGTTEAINLVAQSYGRPLLKPGDEVLITHLEHHANIVPWQILCEQTGAKLVVAPMDARGEVHAEAVEALMSERTRLFAFAHVSNALGTVLPVRRLIAAAKARGITTLIDGAQAVPHMRGGRAGARLRFLRLLGAQDVRPDRHRRALRARGAARAHAALARRRGHDPHGELRQDHLQRPALQIRGRHAEHLGRDRPRRGRRLSCSRSISRRAHAHEHALLEHATRALAAHRGTAHHRHGAPTRRAWCRSWSRACTRTISAPFSTRTASPSAPAIIARCR